MTGDRDGKDEIGTFAVGGDGRGNFYLNTDDDIWAEAIRQLGDQHSRPVSGDFDGDGKNDDIGVVNDNRGPLLHWQLDYDANGSVNKRMNYGLRGDHVVVGNLRHAEAEVSAYVNGRWQTVYDGSTNQHRLLLPGAELRDSSLESVENPQPGNRDACDYQRFRAQWFRAEGWHQWLHFTGQIPRILDPSPGEYRRR